MTAGSEEEPLPGAPPPVDPWQRMTELGDLLDTVSKRLKTVADAQARDRESAHRTRQMAIGLAVSIILDVVLTVVVALLSVSALNQNATLHASQLASCATSNETRAEQRQLWQYIFQISGTPKTTAEKAREQQFLAFVNTTFAPVNCAAVYKS